MDTPDDVVTTKVNSPSVSSAPGLPTKTMPPESSSSRSPLNELLDVALNFLSNSSNEQLLGVFGLLALVTYLILGRVGLLLIGAAVGVILHAHWEGPGHANGVDGSQTTKKRRELALEVSKRLLDWNQRALPLTESDGDGALVVTPEQLSTADLEYATFRPETAAALRALTDAVVQDYVKWWYAPILPEESSFPSSCRRTLTHFVTNVSSHLARKRTEDTFLQFLTNSSSIIIVFFNELAAAFSSAGTSADAQLIVEQYLENSPESSLANVLSQEQQKKKLNMIADDVLANYLDSKAYACSPVRDFLREVFAGLILESTVISLARPEFINEWIVYLLQDGESEIMHAIDAGVEGAGVGASKSSEDPKNAPSDQAKEDQTPIATDSSSDPVDKAAEEAVAEAKRLSALIASQVPHPTPTEPAKDASLSELDSNTEPLAKPSNGLGGGSAGLEDSIPSGLHISPKEEPAVPPVTLYGAYVSVDDDAGPNDKSLIKSRPTSDYLLQVEPSSTGSTGWMVFRKYADFQSLHETLEAVGRLNRIKTFSEKYPALPAWKGKTRHGLARELERYLHEAMKHESLAETDRMRRFLEKQTNVSEASTPKAGFSFPTQSTFENMGKGVLGALTNAPKGVAGGGKAVFDGVSGVFGGGHSRKPTNSPDLQSSHQRSTSKSEQDIQGSSPRTSHEQKCPDYLTSPSASSFGFPSSETPQSPLINEISNDVDSTTGETNAWASEASTLAQSEDRKSLESNGITEVNSLRESSVPTSPLPATETRASSDSEAHSHEVHRSKNPITADETQIAVELIFAVINELYTLSSAWNIRRTLLNAAKSYILRPGSPTLITIRDLLQDSMIEGNTSDDALGEYLKKLRINALPTEEELKEWPPPPSDEEKEQLREKARRLFVQRGIPQALTSVMGAAASREALEKIFDSLQVQTVARGFVFSLMLQGLRVLTL